MEQRLYGRMSVALDATVTDLTVQDQTRDAQLTDVSAGGICALMANALPPGNVIRVDFAEGCLFGQIVHVSPDGPPYRTGIEIFQVLLGTSDLARLIERTLKGTATMMIAAP